jgi:hypothetical protein
LGDLAGTAVDKAGDAAVDRVAEGGPHLGGGVVEERDGRDDSETT